MFAMRKASPTVIAILAIVLIVSVLPGCVTHTALPQGKAESVASSKSLDIDGDGTADLFIYNFAPVRNGNISITRQVSVAAHRSANYTVLRNITDLQMLSVRSGLDSFASSETLALEGCALNAGLKKDCTDLQSCTALCAGAFKCDKVMSGYPGAVASSMIEFVNERNKLDSTLLEARNMVLNLRLGPPEQKGTYLNKLLEANEELAEIYANPFYNRQEILLCQVPDLNASILSGAAAEVGNYTPITDGYDYFVTISVSGVGKEAGGGIEMTDTVPAGAMAGEEDASSQQNVGVTSNGSAYDIFWKSDEAPSDAYMLVYRFTSARGPDEVVPKLRSPALGIGRLDLGVFALTGAAFNSLYGAAGNFFISLGVSLSISLIVLLIAYNLLMVVYYVLRAKMAKENAMAGIRKAFGRTEVRWKTDALMAVLLLAGGYYITVFSVSGTGAPATLLGALDYFTGSITTSTAVGLAGVGCVFLGLLLVYTSAENWVKIAVLEQAYGVVIKEEKDVFMNSVARLRSRAAELQRLVEECTAEEFDVGAEYDVLTAIPQERINELAAKMTPESKNSVEQGLSSVEAAIERLAEKKKTADANWQKWNGAIEKLLTEQDEAYVSSLVTVPASLRAWALSRYAKEHAAEGVVFERDTIRRKKITAGGIVHSMIKQELLLGALVIQKDSLTVAEMAQGSATVQAVLAMKLRSYLRSLARALGQHDPSSFAAVGDRTVLVIIKEGEMESTLLIPREKFKDTIDEWKKKSKMFAKGE